MADDCRLQHFHRSGWEAPRTSLLQARHERVHQPLVAATVAILGERNLLDTGRRRRAGREAPDLELAGGEVARNLAVAAHHADRARHLGGEGRYGQRCGRAIVEVDDRDLVVGDVVVAAVDTAADGPAHSASRSPAGVRSGVTAASQASGVDRCV